MVAGLLSKYEDDLLELGFGAGKLFVVDNYLEAVGVMAALKSGVALDSVRRPLKATNVRCERLCEDSTQEDAQTTGMSIK